MLILTLFHFLKHLGFVTMPTQQQIDTVVDHALAAPLNSLVAIGIILSLLIVFGVGLLIWRFAPMVFKQVQQQIENGRQQAAILERLTVQAETATKEAGQNNQELVKQTALLNDLKVITSTQNLDQKNYQTLVSDNLADHGKQIGENTENIKELYKKVDTLQESVNELPSKLASNLVESRNIAIAAIKGQIDALRTEITITLGKQQNGDLKRQTGSLTAAVVVNTEKP
jgi:archaellum component FlaC